MAQAAPQIAAASPEFKPHLFGKFFLLQRMAVGGMAEIYRARVQGAAGFEKELVVKRILPARARDEGFIKMLVNEAKLTVQLTHSNIAQVYECGTIDDDYFISMELVHGVSLKEMMATFARAGTQISPEQAIFLVLQLLQGLDYAHRKTDGQGNALRIVHCDVSPDNALVSYEGEVKLLDFGIARAATNLSNYKEGMLMGKLGYVAPEQASLEKRWDHRVDLFAAGIILYELLTKQKPFPKATDVESLVQARKAKVVPPTSIEPRLPREIDAIVAKALAYDPDKRYADARSFAESLVDVLFPTPHSAVQDLLATQMKTVFAEKMQRQRAARAHDPLIMKVLSNAAAQAAEYRRISAAETPVSGVPAVPTLPAFDPVAAPVEPSASERTPRGERTPRAIVRTRTVVREGFRLRTVAVVAALLAGLAGAAVHYTQPWLRTGVVVVTSEPPGADVTFDGRRTGLVTPAVIEEVRLALPHEVVLDGPDFLAVTMPVAPAPGRLVAKAHAALAPSTGALRIESDPPGAVVRLDQQLVGRTPITVEGVAVGERHRIDLELPGFEIDQFVVLPEKDGVRFRRKLARLDPRKAKSQAP